MMSLCQRCMLRLNHNSIPTSRLLGLEHLSSRQYASGSLPDNELPVIRVPKNMQRKVSDIQRRKGPVKWKGRIFTARPGTEIISSKRKEFNHYLNQSYDKFSPPKLSSHGWKHSKSQGDHFTILAYKGNPSIASKQDTGERSGEDKGKTFHDLQLDNSLITALDVMDIEVPTSIQKSAIPVIRQGKNTLCAAETGSGKTLAYLLPLMQRLADESRLTEVRSGLPRGVVLVPVGELAIQIWEVAKILGESSGLSVQFLDGKTSLKNLKNKLSSHVDIVISTPGPLLNALRQDFTKLEAVSHVVVDEADTMLDDSFVQNTLKVLRKITVGQGKACKVTAPGEAQLTLVGATMPRKASSILTEIVPPENLETISTPHLHRIMPHVQQRFLRLHSQDKAIKMLEILKKDQRRDVSLMVFCNTTATCDWLALFLQENGLNVLRLHSKMGGKSRSGMLAAFKSGESNIMVCTDIASRGVDTIQVQHVVNFDFPPFMSDYIHRAGRVGRVGSQRTGQVTNFVVHKWDVELVNKIERAVRTREDLPNVNANIRQKHASRVTDEELMGLGRAAQG